MRKRALELCSTQPDLTDPITNPAPYTTQWWYYKMHKLRNEARVGYIDTHLKYNPSTARIEFACIVFTVESAKSICHPSVQDVN
jgi:hypothetical protein